MRLYVSSIVNDTKPDATLIKAISATILQELVDISLEELAIELTQKGKTVVLAELSEQKLSKYTPIVGQELVMLDFDNKDGNSIYTIDDLEQDIFMQNNACFIYQTFSDADSKVDKFRVVFHLDRLITSNNEIEEIYQELFKKYPQADGSVGQTSRIFFGSNSGFEVIDWGNRLDTTDLLEGRKTIIPRGLEAIRGEIIDESISNYELLKLGRYDIVKAKLGDNYSGVFPDEYSAVNHFCSLDLRELLELPEDNPFIDILHDEENPSASIYFSEATGSYFYKCFSENNQITTDIKGLLCKFLKKDNFEVIQLLTYITNSKITMDSDLGKMKLNANLFKKELLNGKIAEKYPELYFYLKKYILEIPLVLEYMFDYVYEDSEGNLKIQNYYSIETLTKMLSRSLNKRISINKTKRILNVIVVTEIIQKVPEELIAEEIYNRVILEQKQDDNKVRTSNIYQPNLLVEEHKDYMGEIGKILKRNNVTIDSLGYELIYRLFGEEKANRDFPQSYKPLVNKGLIKMSRQDTNLTNKSIQLEKSIVKILMKELDSKGYMFEKELISKLARNKKQKIASIRPQYNKVRADIINKYSLKRTKLTKGLHQELGLTEQYSSKVIFYK
ncbi:hypothetical protein IGJ42_001479 [Enterococcus sp. DIV1067f]|jgi:hypothetical protein|uniref:hypothetical protein n=1 Tax=unclassified Enterococcus TaxID=2608891 RepID=UPI000A34FF41|nr:hypothetical protein [Enterococcus sp. 5B3_DIV0040]OTO04245.1 hypothetical protein A5883_001231 [Enterococcus sp. 5B3_DIV0040]